MPASSTAPRRLAAIMFTDIVGYSATAQRDESLSLRLLEEHRQILRPLIRRFEGREIEVIGDAFFIEFSSALQATLCSVEIQRTLDVRNRSAPPGEEIRLRIGLHIGEVVQHDTNIHGDGVNIAARVQQVSLPGGICMSEDVARQVQNKIDQRLIKLGRGELKNIRLPVDIYCVALPWEKLFSSIAGRIGFILARRNTKRALTATALLGAAIAVIFLLLQTPPTTPPADRIAVLPLVNITRVEDDEYFADGLTEELISNLSKIRDLNVIARTSVFKYKGTAAGIDEIGRELNVGTILEGSVRKIGERALITVRLTDVESQKNIWSQEYTREISDVFGVQAEISTRVAEMMKITLLRGEEEKLRQRGTENPEAFRYYLLGRDGYNRRTEGSILTGIRNFNEAIALDSSFALAHAGLADCYTLIGGAGFTSFVPDTATARAKAAARRAIELDDNLAEAHASLAYVRFRLEWDFRSAESGFKRAIELKPGFAKAYEWYGLFLAVRGRLDEALTMMKRSEELDPLSASVSTGVGRIHTFRGEFDRALTIEPAYAEAFFGRGLNYTAQKKYREATEAMNEAIYLSGGRKVMIAGMGYVYGAQGNVSGAEEILETFRNPDDGTPPDPFLSYVVLLGLGRTDQALVYLGKAYEERQGLLLYLHVDNVWEIDHNLPLVRALVRKIGLVD